MTASRRTVLKGGAAAAIALVPSRFAIGATAKIKLGLMLPYSGAYSALGENITFGLKLALAQNGGTLGGREVQIVTLDDESDPAKAPQNATKLIAGEKVDFLVGTVHSGVTMGMQKVATENGTIMIIPNAGLQASTGAWCSKNVFRTSFSNWQVSYPMGKVAASRGLKRVATIAWKYSGGDEHVVGFVEGLTSSGGMVVEQYQVPFPSEEFQAYLTQIAKLKPDAVFAFFAGSGAIRFVKDYAAAGLQPIPLLGDFLTEGLLSAQGAAAEGVLSTLHYADALENAANKEFRPAFKAAFGKEADIFAVQGYDTGLLLAQGVAAVKGDVSAGARDALIAAMEKAEIRSPRGNFTFSKSHNPVQDIYLRQVKNGRDVVLGVAEKALADPAKGCSI